jgi:hypothetical protein
VFRLKGPEERKKIREFRKKVSNIQLLQKETNSFADAEWDQNMNTLRDLIIHSNPRNFLQWGIIKKSMFCGLFREELLFLQSKKEWQTRWKKAITESKIGKPDLCSDFPQSSGNLIHHAYHLAQFEEKTGIDVSTIKTVIEFGGGYGSMCRLFFNLGFSGKYIIYDLPIFSALQEYYLGMLGLKICNSISEFDKNNTAIMCVSNLEHMNELLKSVDQDNSSCFLATWSISETSLETRNSFLPMISNAQSVLIAYQDIFGEVDNLAFFEQWINANKKMKCLNWQIPHIPGSNYLFAINNN